jgi:hypothetical protein
MAAGITQTQAQAQLDAWLAASLAVAQGQEYEIAGRRLKRADAREIREQVRFWEGRVKRLAGGGMRVYGAVPE